MLYPIFFFGPVTIAQALGMLGGALFALGAIRALEWRDDRRMRRYLEANPPSAAPLDSFAHFMADTGPAFLHTYPP